ncbi:metabotropic glutamate receptor 3-like isoform X2 [Amphiura filiformis]|uniref:metabotropic glutamate receptor 3-like isoform X2 n=1 Tax=Amphiura filiformis TaxID=82378 RepID=UPI003B217D03
MESFVTSRIVRWMIKAKLYLILLFVTQCAVGMKQKNTGPPTRAYVKGDVVLGGLFPIHSRGRTNAEVCGKINSDRGIQRAEAMLFAIDKINNDTKLLPGIILGADIRDTCSRDTYALEQSLEFVRGSLTSIDSAINECVDEAITTDDTEEEGLLGGVVGGSYSVVSIQVANLLRLFQIPQVSYASTSLQLSDKTRFEYFARTVPPDTFQARALADIVAMFNWSYVSTVASEGTYGESGIGEFEREAGARNICIAASETIPYNSDKTIFDKMLTRLQKKKNAKVIVLFTSVDDAANVLAAAQRANFTADEFIWLASDGWGVQDKPTHGRQSVAEGAITIELQTRQMDVFDKYFLNLRPEEYKRNPWFAEYWEQYWGCSLGPNSNPQDVTTLEPCRPELRLNPKTHKQEKKTQFVVDAVYALAYALDNMQRTICNETTDGKLCDNMLPLDGEKMFKEFLMDVNFNDFVGSEVRFDQNGDGLGRYDIMNYRRIPDSDPPEYHYVNVGQWSNNLELDISSIVFHPSVAKTTEYGPPRSQCSLPCKFGEAKKLQEDEVCCWWCNQCKPREYLVDEYTCMDCGDGMWPTDDLTRCFKLDEEHMEWATFWSLIPIAVALLGVMATTFVIIVFILFNDTPVVKASSRELSYLLLTGVLMCYGMTFPLLSMPSQSVCTIQRIGLGLSFCICYAALLTKTNRIARIFQGASRSAARPKYISPRSQIVICFAFISVQVFGELVWLIVEPPGTNVIYSDTSNQVILKCNITDISLTVSLVYDMLLIALCTIYAFKTRKIPENFNEAKFIGFTMYTTCIVWLAFVPIYFGTQSDFRVQTTTLCITVSLSASVCLGCLFTPKVYIIVFQPEKNVRRLSSQSTRRSNYDSQGTRMVGETVNNHGQPGCGHGKPGFTGPEIVNEYPQLTEQTLPYQGPPAPSPPPPPIPYPGEGAAV